MNIGDTCYRITPGYRLLGLKIKVDAGILASLHKVYNDHHPEDPIGFFDKDSNLDEIGEKLLSFRKELQKQDKEKIFSLLKGKTSLAQSYEELQKELGGAVTLDGMNLIATLFTKYLDSVVKLPAVIKNGVTREDIINNTHSKYNQDLIFNKLFEYFLSVVSQLSENSSPENQKYIENYRKVINNWPAMVVLAKYKLSKIEGVPMQYGNSTVDVDTEFLESVFNQEESTKEGWMEIKDRISSYGSLGVQIKRILATVKEIESVNPDGSVVYKRDSFGQPKTISPMKAHQLIHRIVINSRSSEEMIKSMRNEAKESDLKWLNQIADVLEQDDTIRAKFYTDLYRDNQLYVKVSRYIKNGIMKYKTVILNKRESAKGTFASIISTPGNATNFSFYDKKGNIKDSKIQELTKEILKLGEVKVTQENGNQYKEYVVNKDIQNIKGTLSSIFRMLNIPFNNFAVSQITSNKNYRKAVITNLLKLADVGIGNTDFTGTNVSSLLTPKTTQEKAIYKPFVEHADAISSLVYALMNEGKYESSALYIDKNGKPTRIQSYVAASYMGDFIKELKQANIEEWFSQNFDMCPQFGYRTADGNMKYYLRWHQDLRHSDFQENIDWMKYVGEDNVTFDNVGSRDHMLDMIAMFFSEKAQRKGNNYVWCPVFILGDSNVSKYIRVPKYTIEDRTDSSGNVTSEGIISEYYNLFQMERARMNVAAGVSNYLIQNGKKGIENFGNKEIVNEIQTSELGTKHKFSVLTFLNKDFQKDNGDRTSEYYEIAKRGDFSREAILEATRKYLNDNFEDFQTELTSLGILGADAMTNGQNKYLQDFVGLYGGIQAIDNTQDKTDEMLKDFFYNTKFATIQQIAMFTIDPSFYVGTKDLQKRYKELHASGNKLDVSVLEENRRTQKVIYFDDIETDGIDTNIEFMRSLVMHYTGVSESEANSLLKEEYENGKAGSARLKKLLGGKYTTFKKYRKNTLTDGQAYRTLDSYRDIMRASGQWTSADQEVYKAIKSLTEKEKLTKEDIDRLIELGSTFQPIKPYMYTIEKKEYGENGETALIPVQHKYAEAILIPQILPKGSKLRAIGEYMERTDETGRNIADMIMSTKCVKVGAWGQCNISNVTKETLDAALSSAEIHKFPLKDYRIQNSITDHTNQVRSMGTQARKLIMSNLVMGNDYSGYFDEFVEGPASTTGKDVMQLYNSVIMANIMQTFEDCVEELGNKQKLSKTLTENVVNSARGRMDAIVAYALSDSEEFKIPLFEGTLKHDSIAMLLSMFRSRVNKQKILGGSAVQVSAMGIEGFEESKNLKAVADPNNPSNILYAECEMPFNFVLNKRSGKTALRYTDYCEYGKLILSNVVFEDNEEYKIIKGRKYLKKEYLSFTNKDGKIAIPKIELDYPHILDRVAYRIPTERNYSMINLKITRFSLPTTGGTIKVPSQYTTIAGFDFDIDKLYFLSYEFKVNDTFLQNIKLSREEKGKILSKIQETHPEFVKELPAITEDSFSQRQLFDIFAEVYDKYKDLAGQLYHLREASGEYTEYTDSKGKTKRNYKHPLNYYFDISSEAAKLAREKGFSSIKELKTYLVLEAAEKLNYIPEVVTVKKDSILTFNDESINAAGITKGSLFREAADELGITLKEAVEETETTSLVEYNFSKSSLNQSKAARNNLIISIMRARLMDPSTFDERYTPGGFPNASAAARYMRNITYNKDLKVGDITDEKLAELFADQEFSTDPEPNYDFSNPMTIVRYNEQNQIAGKLIGIAANQNTNQALSSLAEGLYIRHDGLAFGKMLTHSPRAEMKEGKKILTDKNGIIVESTKAGHTLLAKRIIYTDGTVVDIDLNLAELLAASVDAVKDPVLNYLNINSSTANVACLLMRLGYSMEDIGLFLNQPIIRDVCNEAKLNNHGFLDSAINSHIARLQQNAEVETKEQLSSVNLAKNIIKGRTDKSYRDKTYAASQLKVLEMFRSYVRIASELSQFVGVTKFTAANSVGSTEGDLYAQQMNVSRFVSRDPEKSLLVVKASSEIVNPITDDRSLRELLDQGKFEEYIDRISASPFAYEQLMYDCNRLILGKLREYYPYEQERFYNARTALLRLSKSGKLKPDTINTLHEDMITFLICVTQAANNNFDPARQMYLNRYGQEEGRPVTAREYYTLYFASELKNYLAEHPELMELPIFSFLTFPSSIKKISVPTETTGPTGTRITYLDQSKSVMEMMIENLSAIEDDDADAITNSWLDLSNRGGEHRKIAEDLFYHGLFVGGLGFSPKTLMSLCSVEIKSNITVSEGSELDGAGYESITYSEMLNKILNNEGAISGSIYNEFYKMFLLNNLDIWDFKHKISYKDNKAFQQRVQDNGNTIEVEQNEPLFQQLVYESGNSGYCIPIIEYVGQEGYPEYLIADNSDSEFFNKVIKGRPLRYKKVSALGSGHTKNYSVSLEMAASAGVVSIDPAAENPSSPQGTEGELGGSILNVQEQAEENLIEGLAESMFFFIKNAWSDYKSGIKSQQEMINVADNFMNYGIRIDALFNPDETFLPDNELKDKIKRLVIKKYQTVKETNQSEFEERINDIKKGCRNNGLLVLDANGKIEKSC